jgi:hypothetical protein
VCVAGSCQDAPQPNCDDSNPCTIDSCDPTQGCVHTSNEGASCDDGNECTTNDVCHDSMCGGSALDCNDGDPCTADSCDSTAGCVNTAIPGCTRSGGGGTFCTLTQGAYGAPNGIANGSGTHGPLGWITANPGVLPAFVGGPKTGLSVTVDNQASLEAFMPTGGPPNVLCGNALPGPCPGDLVISSPADVPDPKSSGSGGDGGGTLAGQTLALTLSVALSNNNSNPAGLSSLPLPTATFCTCLGTDLTTRASFGPISTCVLNNAGTVGDLITLADQALRGVPLTTIDVSGCLSYSDINDALDAINTGFDQCRTVCSCS